MTISLLIFVLPALIGVLFLVFWNYRKRWFESKNKPQKMEDVVTPRDFERFVSVRMEDKKGFKKVQLGSGTKDGGIDVVGRKTIFRWLPFSKRFFKKRIIQCKMYTKPIGVDIIRELAYVKGKNRAAIATTARLTKGAQELASKENIDVWLFGK